MNFYYSKTGFEIYCSLEFIVASLITIIPGILVPENRAYYSLYYSFQGAGDTVDEVFETTFFFMLHDSRDIQLDTLNSLGFICIRHHLFMLESKLRQLYLDILTEDFYPVQHKIKVSPMSYLI